MSNTSKVIDLYSGVGGLSLGAIKSDFDLVCAVELEERAVESHKRNFLRSKHLPSNIATLSGKSILRAAGMQNSELSGLIGGPPCQGFSVIGKRKATDTRNNLFSDFFRLVNETRPAFFLAENVPGILNPKYDEIRKNAVKTVEKYYDVLEPIKINASEFGAATTRTRVFFIGVRRDVAGAEDIIDAISGMRITSPTFVKDALAGLPVKISGSWNSFEFSWQKAELKVNSNNPYIKALNEMVEGMGDSVAIARFQNEEKISGCFATEHSEAIIRRYGELLPGKQDRISKSIRLKENGFCPTLRAGTDNTKGSYQAVRPIHPIEPRVITPREAARLQGFPDWFQFHETKWHSFRQIGNSVCPIAAQKVLMSIKNSLNL